MAAQTHTTAMVNASNTYAVNVGQDRLDFANEIWPYGWTEYVGGYGIQGAYGWGFDSSYIGYYYSGTTDYADGLAEENDFQRALLDAHFNFTTAAISAGRAYSLTVGQAWHDYMDEVIDYEGYQDAVDIHDHPCRVLRQRLVSLRIRGNVHSLCSPIAHHRCLVFGRPGKTESISRRDRGSSVPHSDRPVGDWRGNLRRVLEIGHFRDQRLLAARHRTPAEICIHGSYAIAVST